jgi:hypothetical protein
MLKGNPLNAGAMLAIAGLVRLLGLEGVCLSQDLTPDSVRVPMDTVEVVRDMPGKRIATRVLSSNDLHTAPGASLDPMRALAVLGNATSNSDFQAIPILCGDEADRILTLLDGFPIVYPYRLLGTFSLFNPLTTASIDLLSGGYPVSYGGFAPTAIRVNSNLDFNRRASIQTDLNLPVSSALIYLPISDSLRWSATVSARASHVGAAAELLSGHARERMESLMPHLNDFQVIMCEVPSLNLYSMQECLASQEHGSLLGIDRTFDYSWQKGFAGAAVMTFANTMSSEHRFSWTYDNVSLSTFVPIDFIGNQRFGMQSQFMTFRLEDQLHCSVLPMLHCTVGTEILYSIANIQLETFSSWLNGKSPLHSTYTDIALFSEAQWFLQDDCVATLGVRTTYFGFVREIGFEPRGSISYQFSENSSVKLSLGQYLQSPSDFQILHGFLMFLAVPNQTPLMMLMSEYRTTLHVQTHDLADLDVTTRVLDSRSLALDLRFNGYYKETHSLILPARYPSVFTPLDSMSFEPLQAFQARKSGVGVSCRADFLPLNISTTASISNSNSRIIDERTQQEYYTIGDIPISAKLLVQYAPPGWTVGVLYQYSTGAPTTDQYFLKSQNLLGSTIFLPLWKKLNSNRVPNYHRLDLNVSKAWHGGHWRVELICSILNLLGDQNISSYTYDFSEQDAGYARKTPVMNTLPFMPNVGIRCDYTF